MLQRRRRNPKISVGASRQDIRCFVPYAYYEDDGVFAFLSNAKERKQFHVGPYNSNKSQGQTLPSQVTIISPVILFRVSLLIH